MVQIFDKLFSAGEWPLDSAAYIVLSVVVLLMLVNIAIRVMEFVAIKRGSMCTPGKDDRYANPTEGVSVIITVKNNVDLVTKNLPAFLEQDYPNFEVIVVDEASVDDTIDALNILAAKYPNLKISRLYQGVKFQRTKKIALNIGILGAQNDILLFSEIYCAPCSKNWIREMSSSFSDKCGVVIGESRYPQAGRVVDMLRWNHNLHRINAMYLNLFGYIPGCDWTNYGFRKRHYIACRGFSRNNQQIIGYESEIVLKIINDFSASISFNRNEQAIVEYSDQIHQLRADEEYYYAEKRRWSFKSILLSDIAQWVRLLVYAAIIVLPVLFGFPYWFALLLILLTFFVDFLCVNLQMRSMLQRKLFITSLMSTIIGYLGRWCCRFKSLVNESQWK